MAQPTTARENYDTDTVHFHVKQKLMQCEPFSIYTSELWGSYFCQLMSMRQNVMNFNSFCHPVWITTFQRLRPM